MGAGVTGSFGLVGAAGTLMAAYAGRMADRRGPRYVIALALWLMAASYLGIYFVERYSEHAQTAGHFHAWPYLLALGGLVVVLDVGMQSLQLGNQTRNFALQPAARTRINTLYMTTYFIGGAIATAASTVLWERYGIAGVSALEVLLVVLAIARHATGLPMAPPAPGSHATDEPMLHA